MRIFSPSWSIPYAKSLTLIMKCTGRGRCSSEILSIHPVALKCTRQDCDLRFRDWFRRGIWKQGGVPCRTTTCRHHHLHPVSTILYLRFSCPCRPTLDFKSVNCMRNETSYDRLGYWRFTKGFRKCDNFNQEYGYIQKDWRQGLGNIMCKHIVNASLTGSEITPEPSPQNEARGKPLLLHRTLTRVVSGRAACRV